MKLTTPFTAFLYFRSACNVETKLYTSNSFKQAPAFFNRPCILQIYFLTFFWNVLRQPYLKPIPKTLTKKTLRQQLKPLKPLHRPVKEFIQ